MLTSVQIDSFRCFQGLQVPLRPLTVLVGANDSGKSSFLAALRWLAGQIGYSVLDVPRRQPRGEIRVAAGTADEPIERHLQFNEQGAVVVDHWSPKRLSTVGMGFFRPLPSGVPTVSTGTADLQDMAETGDGVAAVLDHILRHDRERFFRIEAAVRELVSGVEQIGIATPEPQSRAIELVLDRGLRLPATSLSTGVRLMLFFVTLAHHPQPPRFILIEEPETGVHPRRLGEIMRLLRALTEGKYGGHAAQVILTTHSPYLLDHVDLTTDQVLVFKREPDGKRTAQPVEADKLKAFLGEFMLGEVWFNEGEEGLVRPRP